MNPKTASLIRVAILGILLLITIGALAYLIKAKADTDKPFPAKVAKFQNANADIRIFGAKIDIKVTRHSRMVGIVIDKPGAFTETEKEMLGRSSLRFVWAGEISTPIGAVTPDDALELKLADIHFMEAGEDVILGLLVAVSCTPGLTEKNAKVTFDLLGIVIRDDKNQLITTNPRWFPKFLTLSCETSI